MAGRTPRVALTLPEPPRPKAKRSTRLEGSRGGRGTAADPARIEALREWRRQEAARRAVPAYVVLHDRTLAALAAARPVDARRPLRDPGHRPGEARGLRQGPARPARRRRTPGGRPGPRRLLERHRARLPGLRLAAGRLPLLEDPRGARRGRARKARRRSCGSRTAPRASTSRSSTGCPTTASSSTRSCRELKKACGTGGAAGDGCDRAPGRPARAAARAAREERDDR